LAFPFEVWDAVTKVNGRSGRHKYNQKEPLSETRGKVRISTRKEKAA
jgi:hypothetical protein